MAVEAKGRPEYPSTRRLNSINCKLQQLRETENRLKRTDAVDSSLERRAEAMGAWREVLGRSRSETKVERKRRERQSKASRQGQSLDPLGHDSLAERILRNERIEDAEIDDMPNMEEINRSKKN